MRYLAMAGLMAVVVAGCGGDPASSRLEPGTEVFAMGVRPSDRELLMVPDRETHPTPTIPVGTRLRIVSDSEPVESPTDPNRLVRIIILEGKNSGLAGEVERAALRRIR